MSSALRCGYGCGADATVDFLWASDAEVWHVCDKHAQALQTMLDQHSGSEWAAHVVRSPRKNQEGEPPPKGSERASAMLESDGSAMGRLGDRLWPLLWRIRNALTRGR